MLLNFVQGHAWSPERPATVALWNGVVVMMQIGEVGPQEVMFTGIAKNGKTLFAKPVEGVKVWSQFGVRSYTHSPGDFGEGVDIDGTQYDFTPGTLHPWLYISHHAHNYPQFTTPPMGGFYYLTFFKGSWKVCGVDDPSQFYNFKTYHPHFVEMGEVQ
jgi:hypothetical protein